MAHGKISFATLTNYCEVLGQFHDARLKGNKNMILQVKKVDGRESLQLISLSQLGLLNRIVRWFGFGPATLTAVTAYLSQHEPYLPRVFSHLQGEQWLKFFKDFHYDDASAVALQALSKERFKQLRNDKIRGIELFKQCLNHHNKKSRFKVETFFKEYEKSDLRGWGASSPLYLVTPRPIGHLPEADGEFKMEKLARKYKIPCLDPSLSQFAYLLPLFRSGDKVDSKNTLGFCYEYGLGVKQNLDKAFECYKEEIEKPKLQNSIFAAHINLGRLYYYHRHDVKNALASFTTAEKLLSQVIQEGERLKQHDAVKSCRKIHAKVLLELNKLKNI